MRSGKLSIVWPQIGAKLAMNKRLNTSFENLFLDNFEKIQIDKVIYSLVHTSH